ncbi:uncharacterized protein LOC133885060 [Phragmites australis]|uniref:uncharacterized protein LOC133885060 n=1 Tax=Phragmites australis TaxID=29695 RepID=UPI002D79005D|nr:uncharacterized protein LOC133885060 [Phragmites australis]
MVQPIIFNIKIHRTLVDWGSSVNLIFAKTLDKMGISRTKLKTRAEPFHGITPKSSNMPLGQIELPVTFGTPNNFHTEKLTFDVTDFEMAYNTIKIPDPKGVITIKGDQRVVVKCDKQSLEMANHFCRTMTTSKNLESKRQTATQGQDSATDSKLVSFVDTSKSDNAAKGETSDGAKDKKTDGGVKAVPHNLSKLAKKDKVGSNLNPK